jgi:hypothetical protein
LLIKTLKRLKVNGKAAIAGETGMSLVENWILSFLNKTSTCGGRVL